MTYKYDTNIMIDIITNWSELDWKLINHNVKRLRERIYQASDVKNFRKLRNLQRLMLKSNSNILFSIKKVGTNSGRSTPGIDGETLDTPEMKLQLFYEIRERGYMGFEPKPSRRIYIKEPNKLRPISMPTIRDRVIQTMVKNALEPEWEAVFEKGSYGFRPQRTIDDAISRVWLSLNRKNCRKWIIDADISKCFDSISHKYLIKVLDKFPGLEIISKWLKTGIIIREIWFGSGDEGTPQGSSISPLLCNIALHGLESEVGVKYNTQGVSQKGRSLIRFADDMVLMCHTREDSLLALEDLKISLNKRGLEISNAKTKIVNILEGFDFLGYNFKLSPKLHASYYKCINSSDPDNLRINFKLVAVYVAPSPKSIKKVKVKLKDICIKYSSNMTTLFIKKMNDVIKGFAQSKWHWHSSMTFSRLDHYLYLICMRWVKRRHPDKNVGWRVKNYFKTLSLGNKTTKWVFFANKGKKWENEDMSYLFMYKFFWFRIHHYRYGRMGSNPDDKRERKYFEDLRIRRGNSRPFSLLFKKDRDLATSQLHLCPICDQSLHNGEQLHIHHITPRKNGGKSIFSNLVYLHSSCHMLAHNITQFNQYQVYLLAYKKSHPKTPKSKTE